eukprot:jgi/Psemu1/314126/fgenesh1_kg.1423_\
MLQYVHVATGNNKPPAAVQTAKDSDDSSTRDETKRSEGNDDNEDEDVSFFKARLVAVLLEYGDKGIDLSNVKKKWKQVWPSVPFPSHEHRHANANANTNANGNDEPKAKPKAMTTADLLLRLAGDVIRFERHGTNHRRIRVLLRDRGSSRETVLAVETNQTETKRNEPKPTEPEIVWGV